MGIVSSLRKKNTASFGAMDAHSHLSSSHCKGDTRCEAEFEDAAVLMRDIPRNAQQGAQSLDMPIRVEWTGTSQWFIEEVLNLQSKGLLDRLITYRAALVHDIALTPYDPTFQLDLARVDNKLGFADIGVANAHRSLILIQAALDQSAQITASDLKIRAISAIAMRLRIDSYALIKGRLKCLQLDAYTCMLDGLLGSRASWDALRVAKIALEKFPGNSELLNLRQLAKSRFEDDHRSLVSKGEKPADVIALTRSGQIFQRPYPWLDASYYKRTPDLLKRVNRALVAENCEIRPIESGSNPISARDLKINQQQCDVGPLGVFATKDIKADQIVMINHSLFGVSNIPSSKLEHCDACHAALIPPYFTPSKIIHPECCSSVAFCSTSCHDTSMTGYHSLLCGRDFDWLYAHAGIKGTLGVDSKWIPIMFLRVVAILLSDFSKWSPDGNKQLHPLQHPLIASMTANYCSAEVLPTAGHTWQYQENVVWPATILLQLGIDIFAHPSWTPEVIQTLIWRIENNASMCRTTLWSQGSFDDESKVVSLVSLNSGYFFLNHSCKPNVSWNGTIERPDMDISLLDVGKGQFLKPGASTVICRAARNVKMGEELLISYVGDPMGRGMGQGMDASGRETKRTLLNKWFEGGCGCEVCKKENETEASVRAEEE